MKTGQETRFALLSVTDKSGLVPFARGLQEAGYQILSTGGTAKLLRSEGIAVTEVADYTGSPEILDGRVKTLHPKVHGAILFDRDDQSHRQQVAQHQIGRIDLVAVNLYEFKKEVVDRQLSAEEAIHHIDIGGPTMLRAAAKNWQHVMAVVDPDDYGAVLKSIKAGGMERSERQRLAAKVFATVSAYDHQIAAFLAGPSDSAATPPSSVNWPASWPVNLVKVQDLRYGENPHQPAALYRMANHKEGFGDLRLLQGKEVSYNNILDLDAATALAGEFDDPAVVIVKHTNPCGCAAGASDLAALFARALACDPKSAFGGIIATNSVVDQAAAAAMTSLFVECIAAPEFTAEALKFLQVKSNIRVLVAPWSRRGIPGSIAHGGPQWRSVRGALLAQSADQATFDGSGWRPVTAKVPTTEQLKDLQFAMRVGKHVKSNAIVFALHGATVGVGAGQMSRIDAANIAMQKAKSEGRDVKGTAMASDAFFPFSDTVQFAATHGVAAIVQPGGSKRDQDSIDAANAAGIAMVFTGVRHFRH